MFHQINKKVTSLSTCIMISALFFTGCGHKEITTLAEPNTTTVYTDVNDNNAQINANINSNNLLQPNNKKNNNKHKQYTLNTNFNPLHMVPGATKTPVFYITTDKAKLELNEVDKSNLTFSTTSSAIKITTSGSIYLSPDTEIGEDFTLYVSEKNSGVNTQMQIRSVKHWEDQDRYYIEDPDALDVLVNKNIELPSNYEPNDLIKPDIPFSFSGENEKRYLRTEAAHALEQLVTDCNSTGLEMVGVSGYRSYQRQSDIFNWNVRRSSFVEANKYSAVPGQSEHQTGLAIDMSTKSVGYSLEESFYDTPEGKWLEKNCYKYGFIIRFPKGKEHITGYAYEPWHIRYVGKEIAHVIEKEHFTLEEYYQKYKSER